MLKKVTKGHLANFVISSDMTITEAIARLDAAGIGALAICSAGYKLCGILTDGDLRRAVIKVKPLGAPCQTIATRNPIVASPSTTRLQALHLMNHHDINHLPIIDEQGVLQDLLLRRDLVVEGDTEADASELLEIVTLLPSASIAEAIAQLDKAGTGALVLCTADRMLFGLLTDGDIRRAILRGVSLETPCQNIASLKPLTVNSSVCATEALEFMVKNDINHLPVVDAAGRVIKFLLRADRFSLRAHPW